jgi:hypothetical protein
MLRELYVGVVEPAFERFIAAPEPRKMLRLVPHTQRECWAVIWTPENAYTVTTFFPRKADEGTMPGDSVYVAIYLLELPDATNVPPQ